MPRTFTKTPSECSPEELATFAALVREGGEVGEAGLEGRIAEARLLAFCYDGKQLLGIAALKNPTDSYRAKVSALSGHTLHKDKSPSELGWVFVTPWARKAGIGKALLKALLHDLHEGVFATSRTDNHGMHVALRRFQFVAVGHSYSSARPGHQIQLYETAKSLK